MSSLGPEAAQARREQAERSAGDGSRSAEATAATPSRSEDSLGGGFRFRVGPVAEPSLPGRSAPTEVQPWPAAKRQKGGDGQRIAGPGPDLPDWRGSPSPPPPGNVPEDPPRPRPQSMLGDPERWERQVGRDHHPAGPDRAPTARTSASEEPRSAGQAWPGDLESWKAVLHAAFEEAQRSGATPEQAQALLATLASSSSVQTTGRLDARGMGGMSLPPRASLSSFLPTTSLTMSSGGSEGWRPPHDTASLLRQASAAAEGQAGSRHMQGPPRELSGRGSGEGGKAEAQPVIQGQRTQRAVIGRSPPAPMLKPIESYRTKNVNFRVYSNTFGQSSGSTKSSVWTDSKPAVPETQSTEKAPLRAAQPLTKPRELPVEQPSFTWENKVLREEPAAAKLSVSQLSQPFLARALQPEGGNEDPQQAKPGAEPNRAVLPPLGSGRAPSKEAVSGQNRGTLPPPVVGASPAAPTDPEALARWLQNRYTSLGQALSSSEAHLNSLGSQASGTLPLILSRLQAAQLLQGAAAATGGLPAAAALIPLMHFQALAQSIGSTPSAASQAAAATAIPTTSPFSSLEAWRQNFSARDSEKAGNGQQQKRALPPTPPGLLNAHLVHQHGSNVKAGIPVGLGSVPARSAGLPAGLGSSQTPARSAWTSGRDGGARARRIPSPAPTSAAEGLPDPHNPFDLHRVRLARGRSADEPQIQQTAVRTASLKSDKEEAGDGRPTAQFGQEHRSAPPLIARGAFEPQVQKQQPTAVTVKRSPDPPGEEAEELAAETLLSLFGPGAREPAPQIAPVRRQRTHRAQVAGDVKQKSPQKEYEVITGGRVGGRSGSRAAGMEGGRKTERGRGTARGSARAAARREEWLGTDGGSSDMDVASNSDATESL